MVARPGNREARPGTDRAACESQPVAHMEVARQAVGGSEYGTRKPRAGRGSFKAPPLASGARRKSHPGSGTGLVSRGGFAAPAGLVATGVLSRRVVRQVPGRAVRRAPGPPVRRAPGPSDRRAPGPSVREAPGPSVRKAPGPSVRKWPGGLPGQLPGRPGRQPEPGEPAQVSRAGERCGPAPAAHARRPSPGRLACAGWD